MRKMKILQTHQSKTKKRISFKIFRAKQSKQKKKTFWNSCESFVFLGIYFFSFVNRFIFPKILNVFQQNIWKTNTVLIKSTNHTHIFTSIKRIINLNFFLWLRNSFLNYKLIGSWIWWIYGTSLESIQYSCWQ